MLLLCLLGLRPAVAQSPALAPDTSKIGRGRLVKYFDFNERPLGNLEPIPMHWQPVRVAGFPHYVTGGFDFKTGHTAAPSFRLDLSGRSVAYRYVGPDIPTRPNSDYLVTAYLRTEGLARSHAFISAVFLDEKGNMLHETEKFSRLIKQHSTGAQWRRVDILLPGGVGAVDMAFRIGLGVWLVQDTLMVPGPLAPRYIKLEDVEGSAWFDDLSIYRLPRAALETTEPGNVFEHDVTPVLRTLVTDSDGSDLSAVLQVRSADEREVLSTSVPIPISLEASFETVELPRLAPGLYHASLDVSVLGVSLARRELAFARLGPRIRPYDVRGTHFGVVLEEGSHDGWAADERLLRLLSPAAVKVPFWGHSRSTSSDRIAPSLDAMIKRLAADRFELIAVLTRPPHGLATSFAPSRRTLLDVFNAPPEQWEADLYGLLARYSDLVGVWQIGGELHAEIYNDPRLAATLDIVRDAIRNLQTRPMLAVPAGTHLFAGDMDVPADAVSLGIESDVVPDMIPEYIKAYRSDRGRALWAYVVPQEVRSHNRLARLADFAKRLVFCRQAGADTVFLRQPWKTRWEGETLVTEPTEDYVVAGALIDLLAGSTAIGPVFVAPNVTAYGFTRRNKATLVLWNNASPDHPIEHALNLPGATRAIDILGRQSVLKTNDDGAALVSTNIAPTFIDGIEAWFVEFRSKVRLEPYRMITSHPVHEHTLIMTNPRDDPISGEVVITGPESWNIFPNRFGCSLKPHEVFKKRLGISFPNSEPAGEKQLHARITLDAGKPYHLDITLPLRLGLEDVEVYVMTNIDGDALVLRHSVTNRAEQAMSFRSMATVPGRSRQYRTIPNILPGQTITKKYRLANGARLSGRKIRMTLVQIGGPRIHNLEVEVP